MVRIAGVQGPMPQKILIINPSAAEIRNFTLDLTVAGTKEAINMVESGAQELSEDIMLQALLKGHEAIQELVDFQIISLQLLVWKGWGWTYSWCWFESRNRNGLLHQLAKAVQVEENWRVKQQLRL